MTSTAALLQMIELLRQTTENNTASINLLREQVAVLLRVIGRLSERIIDLEETLPPFE